MQFGVRVFLLGKEIRWTGGREGIRWKGGREGREQREELQV
jgi:hypothetical protein